MITNLQIKINYFFLSFVLLIIFILPVLSQEVIVPNTTNNTVKKLTLEDSIDIALNENRTILEQKEDNKIYKLKVSEQVTNLLPYFYVTNNYLFNSNLQDISIPGMSNMTSKRNQNSTSIYLSQPLSKLIENSLNVKIARENYKNSKLQTELDKQATINNIASQYYDIIKEQRIIDLYIQDIVKLEGYYKVAMDNYTEGKGLTRDYLKIQYEIDNAKHNLLVEQDKLNLYYYQFKYNLGVNLNENIELSKDFKEQNYQNRAMEELLQTALENRPDVKQQINNIKIAKLNKDVKIAQYIPEVSFVTAYNHLWNYNYSVPNNVTLGVNLTYNLWDWNNRYMAIKEQRSNIKKQQLSLIDIQDQIFIDIKSQLNTINETFDLISVSKSNVTYAKESLRITENRFNEGLALIIDLLDDQTSLLNAEIQLASSELDYQKSLVNLKKILGVIDKNN